MSPSLPSHPTLETLKKQAKALLKAYKNGDNAACDLLRRLARFSGANDARILAAEVTLQEAQHAVALSYGFKSWKDLREHVGEVLAREVRPEPLERLAHSDVPDATPYTPYMVRGYIKALTHAGADVTVHEFTAASGWAFSFSYKYDDISPAFLALRGNPNADGPFEVFRFLPERLGFDYDGSSL